MDEKKQRRRATTSTRVNKSFPAYRIIVLKFGGLTNFCDATGFHTSTVHNWLRAGLIPAKWHEPGLSLQRYIIGRAFLNGIAITPYDFVEEDLQDG